MNSSSESEVDFDEINIWKPKRNKSETGETKNILKINRKEENNELQIRFEKIKEKLQNQRERDFKLEQKREKRKNIRLMKKLHNTDIKKATDKEMEDSKSIKNNNENDCEKAWKEVKAYLTVNDHIAGPVSHGKYGPKTEVESMIDTAISKEDFERAELLSNYLADREFATKISKAFAAKKYAEMKAKEDAIQKAKQQKKLKWGFEAKERWEMKGNM